MARSLRGVAAVVGIGGTGYQRRGQGEPELKMLLRAIVAACADAGVSPHSVDGLCSYGEDDDEGPKVAAYLGMRDFRFAVKASGGGGGLVGAISAGAAAIHAGLADTVVVHRALAQAQSGRQEFTRAHFGTHYRSAGVVSAVQTGALRTQRLFEHHGVPTSAMEAFVRATYHHAQANPEAMAYGKPLDADTYRSGRMISDPHRLYDCSRESDGAFALVLTSADRARDLTDQPVYLLGAGHSGPGEAAENAEPYTSSNFVGAARRLYEQAGLGPSDVDVAQFYENTAGPAILAVIEHGFCDYESAGEFLTFENLIAPTGRLPVNTAGGNLAAGFVHGIGLALEAVRQIRGESVNQVPGAAVSLLVGGPQAPLTGSALFGNQDALG